MNTNRFNKFVALAYALAFALVVVAVCALNVNTALPTVNAAHSSEYTFSVDSPTVVIVGQLPNLVGMDKDAHRTGPVSVTCIARDLFKYHNLDKAYCGDGATTVEKKDNKTVTTTTTVVDDGGDNGCTVNCGGTDDGGSDDGGSDDGDDGSDDGGCTTNCGGTDDGGTTDTNKDKVNNGHGNNKDHCDVSNPSGKCPDKQPDPSAPTDDENKDNGSSTDNGSKDKKEKKADAAGLALLALMTAARKSKKDSWEFINGALWFGTTASLYKHNGVPCVCIMNGTTQLALEHFETVSSAKAWREAEGKTIAMSAKS